MTQRSFENLPKPSSRRSLQRCFVGYLLLLSLTFSQFGCLGIINIEPQVEDPINHPVQIKLYDPPERTLTIKKTEEPDKFTTFKVLEAYDSDKEDTLYAFWFLNRHTKGTGSFVCQGKQGPELLPKDFNPAQQARPVNFTCTLQHTSSGLLAGQTAILEVFLVDRETDVLKLTEPIQIWPEKSTVAERTWYLNIE